MNICNVTALTYSRTILFLVIYHQRSSSTRRKKERKRMRRASSEIPVCCLLLCCLLVVVVFFFVDVEFVGAKKFREVSVVLVSDAIYFRHFSISSTTTTKTFLLSILTPTHSPPLTPLCVGSWLSCCCRATAG